MKGGLYGEHLQVLKTMEESGLISRQAMKTVRGQLLRLNSHIEREEYLKKVIKNRSKQGGDLRWAGQKN